MKKVVSLLAVAGLIAAAGAAYGETIVNSKHNLTRASTVSVLAGGKLGTSTQICIYCHAPHGAKESLPLWNRSNPSAAGFTLYSGVGMANVSFKSGFTTDSTSLFCMSCHDGNTNMNNVHNVGNIITNLGGTLTSGTINSTANLTTDLSKTHPVNFPVTLNGQNDLYLGTGATMGTTNQFPLFKANAGVGPRGTTNRSLECGSCHAVHDNANQPFLRGTMTGSALCLGCHNK